MLRCLSIWCGIILNFSLARMAAAYLTQPDRVLVRADICYFGRALILYEIHFTHPASEISLFRW